ncbi:hypothetical protein DPMN_160745 [Dreissena polymorpha]|uniref:Uncharacterized protein n=1 Tax=Dreissena polymorpha TaxID=45954 RepID=A0A9D4IQF3_DREPO|nr:hypothetical protein DPMN_160745 [Dreissena polymorpha]
MVGKARESVTLERKNARKTGGGQPMKAHDNVTMSIIDTMPRVPRFSIHEHHAYFQAMWHLCW